jgi:hypothetical protein
VLCEEVVGTIEAKCRSAPSRASRPAARAVAGARIGIRDAEDTTNTDGSIRPGQSSRLLDGLGDRVVVAAMPRRAFRPGSTLPALGSGALSQLTCGVNRERAEKARGRR